MLWYSRVHLGMIWRDSAQIIPKWTFMHRIALSQLNFGLRPTPLGSAGRAKQRQPELLRESRDLAHFLAYAWLWPPQRK